MLVESLGAVKNSADQTPDAEQAPAPEAPAEPAPPPRGEVITLPDDANAGEHFDLFMGFFSAGLTEPVVTELVMPDTPTKGTYKYTEHGYFLVGPTPESRAKLRNALASIVKRGDSLKPPGVFLRVNPVDGNLLARANERLVKAEGKGDSAGDDDVLCLRHFCIDFDPVRFGSTGKRISGVPATDAEKAAAVAVAQAVLDDLRSRGFPEPCVTDSGNGQVFWFALDNLPTSASAITKSALDALSKKYSTPNVEIDVKVANPNRLMRLAGSTNRKGDHTPKQGRPHRPCRVIQVPTARVPVPLELIQALAAELDEPAPAQPDPTPAPKPKPKAASQPRTSGVRAAGDAVARCRGYLAKVAPAVEGDNGSGATIRAARIIWNDFGLDHADGFPILAEWNQRCVPPWPMEGSQGLIRKWEEAVKAGPGAEGRGFRLRADRPSPNPAPAGTPPTGGGAGGGGGGSDDSGGEPGGEEPGGESFAGQAGDPMNPHRLARRYLLEWADGEGRRTLRYHCGEFLRWQAGAYRPIPNDDFAKMVARFLEREAERIFQAEQQHRRHRRRDAAEGEDGEGGGNPFKVTRGLVADVLQALGSVVLVEAHVKAPSWIDGATGPDPVGILAMRNGIVDLAAAAYGRNDALLPATPGYFTMTAAPFDFAPDAPRPVLWLEFLQQLWPDDPATIEALQMWFGYLLAADTRQQKILFLHGPPRSGKGTIARVLTALVGEANVAGMALNDFGQRFGLWPLLNASVAFVSDARLSRHTNTGTVIEQLLRISGEDAVTVDRKQLSLVTTKLPTRLVFLANELPRLDDASGALPNRFIILRFTRSFLGKEDFGLTEKLLAELPSILLWAIEGWRKLREAGRLPQPATGGELTQALSDLSSPVSQFVRECCVLGTGKEFIVETEDLYEAWGNWCQVHNKREWNTMEVFGRDLMAAHPEVEKRRPRDEKGERYYAYIGIRLRTAKDDKKEREEEQKRADPGPGASRTAPGPDPGPTGGREFEGGPNHIGGVHEEARSGVRSGVGPSAGPSENPMKHGVVQVVQGPPQSRTHAREEDDPLAPSTDAPGTTLDHLDHTSSSQPKPPTTPWSSFDDD